MLKQGRKLCNKFLCFSMLFFVASLLIGALMGSTAADPSRTLSEEPMHGPCKHIRAQQKQIFDKMTRIERQLELEDVVD